MAPSLLQIWNSMDTHSLALDRLRAFAPVSTAAQGMSVPDRVPFHCSTPSRHMPNWTDNIRCSN